MLNFDDFVNETEEIGISKIIFNNKEECFLGSAIFLIAKKFGGGNNGKLFCIIGS